MNEKINLHEPREFGDLISDTFLFIRENFKPLGKALLFIAGPFILLSGLLGSAQTIRSLQLAHNTINSFNSWMGGEILIILVLYVVIFANYTIISGVVYEYLVLYEKTGPGEFTFGDLVKELKADILEILAIALLSALFIFIGMFVFVLPGIYLSVVLSPVIIIAVYEQKGFFDAFERCRRLISGYWWFTFSYLFVLGIIAWLLSMLIGLPKTIMTVFLTFNTVSGHVSPISQIIIMAFSILASIIYFLYAIPMIGIAFHYFNLLERKEGTGLLSRIDDLNK